MVDLLNCTQLAPSMDDLVDVIDLDLSGVGQDNRLDLLLCQTILLAVLLHQDCFLFFSQLVTIVDQEALLAMADHFGVVLSHFVDVDFKAKERCKRLLPQHPLCLQVHLLDCL